jgi:hypothetical protein
MTSFWRTENNTYHLQTNDRKIHEKIRRREGAVLFAKGINCNFWIYILKYNSPRDAKRGIKRIMGTSNDLTLCQRTIDAKSTLI